MERNRELRLARKQNPAEKTRLIRDIRLYYRPHGEINFAPYDHQLCGKILERLRRRKFRLPGYTHLYIMASDTPENALYHATRAENWHVYGIADVDAADFAAKEGRDKRRAVFDIIRQGLEDIAEIDALDAVALSEVLNEIAL